MTSTPARAIDASQKSSRRSRHSCRILPTFIIPATATTTMAPSVASGSGSNSGVRNRATRAVAAAAVISEAGVLAPARSLAADFESDDPMGNPEKRPAPVFAAPRAISSRFGSIFPPCSRANSSAGPIASAKATRAMASAPARSSGRASSPTPGSEGPARPAGSSPTTATPWASRPKTAETAMDPRSTTSAAGTRGRSRSRTIIPTMPPAPTARVSRSVSRRCGKQVPHHGQRGVAVGLDAEDLGDLLDGDQQRQPEHEAEQHGLREELRDPAELEDPGRDRDEAGQDRERRGQGDVLGAPGGGELRDGRRRHDRDRRGDRHDQLARAAEQRVGEQPDRRRVEGVLGRHSGQLRVGHALRDEDGAHREPGDEVEAEPAPLVAGQPREDRPGMSRRSPCRVASSVIVGIRSSHS